MIKDNSEKTNIAKGKRNPSILYINITSTLQFAKIIPY